MSDLRLKKFLHARFWFSEPDTKKFPAKFISRKFVRKVLAKIKCVCYI